MKTMYLITTVLGLAVLWIIGLQDLRKREISSNGLYAAVLMCGLFSKGHWAVKLICLIAIPSLLLLCASWIVKHKARRTAKMMDIPYEKPSNMLGEALTYIGGADLKTIAVAGVLCGPYWLASGLLAGLITCCVPFIIKPTLGMTSRALAAVKEGYKGRVPFCFILIEGVSLVAGISILMSRLA